MKRPVLAACLALTLVTTGCGVLRQSPKFGFADGYYTAVGSKGAHRQRVYVHNAEDSIITYLVQPGGRTVLTTDSGRQSFPAEADSPPSPRRFLQPSLDVDFLTIPFKFRSSEPSLPRQFNSTLNGAVYLGYRTDSYLLSYRTTPLGAHRRHLSHYGFSFGLLTGLGGTAMNPWVTNDYISSEYDGVVWSKGLAGIIAVNSFTAGLALGWDHLLDHNRTHWIYQGRPWVGLAFGLNLN